MIFKICKWFLSINSYKVLLIIELIWWSSISVANNYHFIIAYIYGSRACYCDQRAVYPESTSTESENIFDSKGDGDCWTKSFSLV